MDAPRDFLIFYFFIFIFSPNEQRARGGGGGGALPDFFFFFFPCLADHERDWPPCKVVFFGLATNALNVRNNNNNTIDQQEMLFLVFSVLVTNPKKILYTMAYPARGLPNKRKNKKKKNLPVPMRDNTFAV